MAQSHSLHPHPSAARTKAPPRTRHLHLVRHPAPRRRFPPHRFLARAHHLHSQRPRFSRHAHRNHHSLPPPQPVRFPARRRAGHFPHRLLHHPHLPALSPSPRSHPAPPHRRRSNRPISPPSIKSSINGSIKSTIDSSINSSTNTAIRTMKYLSHALSAFY